MANYENLKSAIKSVIKANGNQEITGDIMQNALLSMINSLGEGYQFMGVATPETNPNTPDQKVFYIANSKGVYANFGSISLESNEISVLMFDGQWHKEIITTSNDFEFAQILFYPYNKNIEITINDSIVDGITIKFPQGMSIGKRGGVYEIPEGGIEMTKTGLYIYIVKINNLTNEISISRISEIAKNESVICSISSKDDTGVLGLTNYTLNGVKYSLFNDLKMKNFLQGYNYAYAVCFRDESIPEFTWDGKTRGTITVKIPANCFIEYPNATIKIDKELNASEGGGYFLFVFFDVVKNDLFISKYLGAYNIPRYVLLAMVSSYQGYKPEIWTLFSIYKYNGVVYRQYNDNILSPIKDSIAALENTFANVADNIKIGSGLNGVTFPNNVPMNIKNAIKRVWVSCGTAGVIEKMLDNLDSPLMYISKINNVPEAYAPYVGISRTTTADDQAFYWYLTNQTHPRKGTEILSAMMNSSLHKELGLTAFPYVNIELDWDVFGENVKKPLVNISLDLSKLARQSMPIVSLNEVGDSMISNSFVGKTIVCFGDSLTEMIDTSNALQYTDYLSSYTGARVINVGIGGSQIRQRLIPTETPTNNSEAYAALDIVNMIKASCEQDFTKQVNAAQFLKDNKAGDNTEIVARLAAIDWSKVDAITIFAGTNDWHGAGERFGQTGSKDISYTLGAINTIIEKILTTYPNVKIFWFTPIIRYTGDLSQAINMDLWGDNEKGANEMTLKEFSAGIMNEVSMNHIPVCDMYNTLGWNLYNMSNYFVGVDGTHPRKLSGVTTLAKKLAGFLISNHTL